MAAKQKKVMRPLKSPAGVKKAVKRTKAGQNFTNSGLCIGTHSKGKPCCIPVGAKGVPYCKPCMKSGDPSLKVVKHPLAGKCLVAARDLPKGYRMALWGKLTKKKDMTEKAMEWGFDITGGWFLDPTPCPGSFVQFCPCPGPNEVAVLSTPPVSATRGTEYGAWPFITNQPIKKNTQVTLQYGTNSKDSDDFFTERGITRLDVAIKGYPAVRRKGAPPAPKLK